MRRIIWFLVLAVLAIAFAWFIASLPGRITAQFGGTTVEAATPVAAAAFLVLLAALYAIYRVLAGLLGLPYRASAWRGRRRRNSGDLAVTRALVALAAGEKSEARREAHRARALLGDTPQTLLLAAEAGRLAGRDDEAAAAFRQLSERRDAAFLGYRGLLRQALAREDWHEAAALARQAEAVQPGAAWLRHERFRLAVHASNWAEALDLSETDAPRAALAAAAAEAEPDSGRATKLARDAWKQDAALAPAALAYAERLRRDGREKRALAVIRESWVAAPHPDLAAFALAPIADPLERVKAAKQLVQANPSHVESRLLLARTALNAGLTGEARHHAEDARAAGLNQRRLWLLLADIEEAEQGDTEAGRLAQREALRKAATADPDPAWHCVACRAPHRAWTPACTACGEAGTLRWTAPAAPGTDLVPALRD